MSLLVCIAFLAHGSTYVFAQGRGTPTPVAVTTNTQAADVAAMKKEIAALRSEIEVLKAKLIGFEAVKIATAKLSESLSTAESDISVLKFTKADSSTSAVLSTDSHGFARADTDAGSFLVAVEDVTPYLDGFKVKLSVGNINTSVYTNVKLKLSWYPSTKYSPYKQKDESLNQCLKSGIWNPIEVILPNTKPEELGRISVVIDVSAATVSFVCK